MASDPTSEFLAVEAPKLLRLLERYLGEEVSHAEASAFAWTVIEKWSKHSIAGKTPESTREEVFWAAVWALQHLADSGHWSDGVTQRELEPLIRSLRIGGQVPPGISALRP